MCLTDFALFGSVKIGGGGGPKSEKCFEGVVKPSETLATQAKISYSPYVLAGNL